jgi:hypothetical protein
MRWRVSRFTEICGVMIGVLFKSWQAVEKDTGKQKGDPVSGGPLYGMTTWGKFNEIALWMQ